MKYTILLSRSDNTKEVEAQEQNRFIKSVLESLEVPIEFDPDTDPSIEQKQKFRSDLREFGLHIHNDMNGGIKILLGEERSCIAEWFKSTYKLKQDLSQPEPFERLYIEMYVHFWTVFEDDSETKGGINTE